jgi:hypothetical protein
MLGLSPLHLANLVTCNLRVNGPGALLVSYPSTFGSDRVEVHQELFDGDLLRRRWAWVQFELIEVERHDSLLGLAGISKRYGPALRTRTAECSLCDDDVLVYRVT